MAWSKVVATRNSDLPRESSSICSLSTLMGDDDKQQQAMDDLLKNMYNEHEHHTQPNASPPAAQVGRTVEEVWKEIVAGGGGGDREEEAQAQAVIVAVEGGEEGGDQVRAAAGEAGGGGSLEEMTLEDFLTRAGAVREEDVGVAGGGGGVPIGYGQFQVQPLPPQGHVVYGNGGTSTTTSGGGGGRVGKRRAVQEAPLDKATQQKQRRMIKNRESAARSRERKQAYTIELESIVTRLEEENGRLLREEAEQKKRRFKRLMENLIPIAEKKRPPRVLRRVHSVHW